MRRLSACAVALGLGLVLSPCALAGVTCSGSRLAIEMLAQTGEPRLWLAQRVIEREWTTRSDSAYAENYLPGSKSELGAAAMSAVIPGTGQLYCGERSGYFFALAEVAGWASWWLLSRDADNLRTDAEGVAGVPSDSASGWSFERWADATKGDPSELEALYAADREAYYDLIAADSRYAAGWSSGTVQSEFSSLRDRSDQKLSGARGVGVLIWLNHVVAAADAFRAARFHNLPLSSGLQLKADGGWRSGQPAWTVALEGKFR